MGDAEMWRLNWMCGHTRLDMISNEDIQKKVWAGPSWGEDKGKVDWDGLIISNVNVGL